MTAPAAPAAPAAPPAAPPAPPAAAAPPVDAHPLKSWWERALEAGGIPIFLLLALAVVIVGRWLGQERLEIVAALDSDRVSRDSTVWAIEGRVLQQGRPADSAYVWVVARETQGNRASPPGRRVDAEGRFTVAPIPRFIGANAVTEVKIFATRDGARGEETLTIKDKGAFRNVDLSLWKVVGVPMVFLLSVLVAFSKRPTRAKYAITLVLAIALTVGMIVLIVLGLSFVNNTGDRTETISLGFGSLFRGYYVGGTSEEWLFSLSSPQWAGDGETKVMTGFGAPLWVILMSVIGAGLLTIALIVQEISDGIPTEVGADAGAKIRERLEGIVRHQFFIMFSPIGAIFIYQALVLAKAAEHPFSVALAALGAGAALNGLLSKAVEVSQGLLKK